MKCDYCNEEKEVHLFYCDSDVGEGVDGIVALCPKHRINSFAASFVSRLPFPEEIKKYLRYHME